MHLVIPLSLYDQYRYALSGGCLDVCQLEIEGSVSVLPVAERKHTPNMEIQLLHDKCLRKWISPLRIISLS